jgi:hypothetical protein
MGAMIPPFGRIINSSSEVVYFEFCVRYLSFQEEGKDAESLKTCEEGRTLPKEIE